MEQNIKINEIVKLLINSKSVVGLSDRTRTRCITTRSNLSPEGSIQEQLEKSTVGRGEPANENRG